MLRSLITLIIAYGCLLNADAEDLFSRPVMIGASLSDGYQHTEKLGGPESDALALDLFLQRDLKLPESKISNFSNRFCFIYPLGISQKQLNDAKKLKPTVLFAVDQLFWHLYGDFASQKQRLITFKAALQKLDPITCPLVIGNIPDAKHSIGKMLSPRQVPELETIQQANKILQEWVKKRKNTAIIDLSSFMKQSIANEEIKLTSITYPKGTTKQFLQSDLLHPTPAGVAALSLAVIDALDTLK